MKVSFSIVTLIDLIDTLAVFDHMFSLKSYNMHLYNVTVTKSDSFYGCVN